MLALTACAVWAVNTTTAFSFADYPFTPTVSLNSDTSVAGESPDLSIHLRKTPNHCLAGNPEDPEGWCRLADMYKEQDLKKLVAVLPPGLIPDPNGVPQCTPTYDNSILQQETLYHCPASTQVGTLYGLGITNCKERLHPWPNNSPYDPSWCLTGGMPPVPGIGGPSTLYGHMYMGVTRPGEQAHLIILSGVMEDVHDSRANTMRTDLSIKVDSSGAIAAVADELPDLIPLGERYEGITTNMPLQIYDLTVTIRGKTGGAQGHPLLTNATDCGAKQLTGLAQGYLNNVIEQPNNPEYKSTFFRWHGEGDGKTVPISAPYRVKGCDRIPYAPKFDLSLDNDQPSAAPGITATITQARGEQNTGSVGVVFPSGFKINTKNKDAQCSDADFTAGNCPAGSAIGSAEADSDLLPLGSPPLRSTVYLGPTSLANGDVTMFMKLANDWLPGGVDLKGSAHINHDSTLEVDFNGVPNIPIKSFAMRLDGGQDKGLLLNPKSCGQKSPRATLTSHDGRVVTATPDVQIACTKPALTVDLSSRRAGSKPTVTLSLSSSGMKNASFTLPRGLRVRTRLARGKSYGSLELRGTTSSNAKLKARGKRGASSLYLSRHLAAMSTTPLVARGTNPFDLRELPPDTTDATLELGSSHSSLLTLPRCARGRHAGKTLAFKARLTGNDGNLANANAKVKLRCKRAAHKARRTH